MDIHELGILGRDIDRECSARVPDIKHLRQLVGQLMVHLQNEHSRSMEQGRIVDSLEEMLKLHHETLFGDPSDPEKKPGIIHEWSTVKNYLRFAAGILSLIGLKQIVEVLNYFAG